MSKYRKIARKLQNLRNVRGSVLKSKEKKKTNFSPTNWFNKSNDNITEKPDSINRSDKRFKNNRK